jgi:hypothetical protein
MVVMIGKTDNGKIVPINWVDDTERWVVIPGTRNERTRSRTKELCFRKKNCYFASNVPKSIFDFIYRAVRQLDLGDRTLIFARGTVRVSKKLSRNAVSIQELDWGVGTLVTIPRILPYRELVTLTIDNTEHTLRLMELVVLQGLLRIACPRKTAGFYSTEAVLILARGWSRLDGNGIRRL